jgi:ethanolamine ammonia-lyase small subunit
MSFDKYRSYTQARIGLGNAGAAIPTKAWLWFSYHHAQAVDAINVPWDMDKTCLALRSLGYDGEILATPTVSREEYLLRPDLGRILHDDSRKLLAALPPINADSIFLLVSNGLSSLAIQNHLDSFLSVLLKTLRAESLRIAAQRIFLATNGRVALIDDVGEVVKPKVGITIIGERPGLSAPDSLAVYLTYEPRKGRLDAERNCVSNIRPPHGLSYEEASRKLVFLIKEAMRRKLSGVTLKEEGLPTKPFKAVP